MEFHEGEVSPTFDVTQGNEASSWPVGSINPARAAPKRSSTCARDYFHRATGGYNQHLHGASVDLQIRFGGERGPDLNGISAITRHAYLTPAGRPPLVPVYSDWLMSKIKLSLPPPALFAFCPACRKENVNAGGWPGKSSIRRFRRANYTPRKKR
ncbi:hypothetical protein KM043_012652 [Ampulex compressa]|nr:hypothetical protein KM043_012652 [Ampulex compressa]